MLSQDDVFTDQLPEEDNAELPAAVQGEHSEHDTLLVENAILRDTLAVVQELSLDEVATVTDEAERLQAQADIDRPELERLRALEGQSYAPRMVGYVLVRGKITMRCPRSGQEFSLADLVYSGAKTLLDLFLEMLR